MVGRRHDHGIDVTVIDQPPEVAKLAGLRPHQCGRLLEPALVDLGDGHEVDVRKALEVEDVPLADEPKADEAQSHSLIGSQDSPVTRGRESRCDATAEQRAAIHRGQEPHQPWEELPSA